MPGPRKRRLVKIVNFGGEEKRIVSMIRKGDIPVVFKDRRETKEFSEWIRRLGRGIDAEMSPHLARIDFGKKDVKKKVEQIIRFSPQYRRAKENGKITIDNLLKVDEKLVNFLINGELRRRGKR